MADVITYKDKVDLVTDASIAAEYKFSAADANQLKRSVNDIVSGKTVIAKAANSILADNATNASKANSASFADACEFANIAETSNNVKMDTYQIKPTNALGGDIFIYVFGKLVIIQVLVINPLKAGRNIITTNLPIKVYTSYTAVNGQSGENFFVSGRFEVYERTINLISSGAIGQVELYGTLITTLM